MARAAEDRDARADCDLRHDPAAAWKADVALEMWIDLQQAPVRIRLAGTLNGGTAANLRRVIEELIADGSCTFVLETRRLTVTDGGGRRALGALDGLMRRSGGRLLWDEPDEPAPVTPTVGPAPRWPVAEQIGVRLTPPAPYAGRRDEEGLRNGDR